MGIKVFTGSWYLGVFIGYGAVEATWLGEKVQGWEVVADTLAGLACQHPHAAYACI